MDAIKMDILPTLSEEYDKPYYVYVSTIPMELMEKSGYRIFHRPNIAMKGSTRTKWQLNPHTKFGVDAGPEEGTTITFEEYLELFIKKDDKISSPEEG